MNSQGTLTLLSYTLFEIPSSFVLVLCCQFPVRQVLEIVHLVMKLMNSSRPWVVLLKSLM